MSGRLCIQRLIAWRYAQLKALRSISRFHTVSLSPSEGGCLIDIVNNRLVITARPLVSIPSQETPHTNYSVSSTDRSKSVPTDSGKEVKETSTENRGDPVGADSSSKSGTPRHPDAEKDPLPEWPDGVNPRTGEKGGPKGPEPTRYGDWERKGRVSDF